MLVLYDIIEGVLVMKFVSWIHKQGLHQTVTVQWGGLVATLIAPRIPTASPSLIRLCRRRISAVVHDSFTITSPPSLAANPINTVSPLS